MKIGLPRALLYHYYYPFWKRMFEELNIDVVISDITSKLMVQKGIKVTVPEICLPIKIFNAHVINLLEKNVDYIFIPRFVSIAKDEWLCPKYLGLPELVKYTIPKADKKILTLDIDSKREDTGSLKNYQPLCDPLGISKGKLKTAIMKAAEEWARFRQLCMKGYTFDEAEKIFYHHADEAALHSQYKSEVTLGVLGYVYNIYDPFVSMDIVKKLRQMDVNVITFDMMNLSDGCSRQKKSVKNLYWTFTNKVYETATNLINDSKVDGLIHVTAFGCGPDSILGKYVELDSEKFQKPFMTLRVDEHTGESHLQTRIEAFVDMIKRKKFLARRSELA